MAIENGSTRADLNGVYQVLINDEILLRLLNNRPKDAKRLDPLSEELPDIIGSDEYWDIVDDCIILSEKNSDITLQPKCRIYISLGRRRPVFANHFLVTQEIQISVYMHENFESDMRDMRLLDRINELIVMKEISGLTRLDYMAGNPRVAPPQYRRYDHIYGYVTGKK